MNRAPREKEIGHVGEPTLDRATLARLAAHERWARVHDRAAATSAARAAAENRFVTEARRLNPGLPDEEVWKRAKNLRSAHAIRAARARWADRCHPPSARTALVRGAPSSLQVHLSDASPPRLLALTERRPR